MPLVLRPDQLTAGMVIATTVKRGAVTLLPGGRQLTEDDIATLARRYPQQRVAVTHPQLDGLLEFENDTRDRETAEAARKRAGEVMSMVLRDMRQPASRRKHSDCTDQVERAVTEILEFLQNNPIDQVLPKDPIDPESYLADHMSNCFLLAMQLGAKARDYVARERSRQTSSNRLDATVALDLVPLGLGAMFMDLGMLELSRLENNTGELTDADHKAIREHPERGVAMLPGRIPPATRMIVRTHHETMDQTGYPHRPAPEKLHVFSRIIRIVDVYDAAITPRPWRKPLTALRILWELTYGSLRNQVDPTLMRFFNAIVCPFPVGQRLQLEDGTVAIVTARSRDPFAPKASIAFDAQGRLLPKERIAEPTIIDGQTTPRIARVDDEDVSYLYTRPHDESACDNHAAAATDNPSAGPPRPHTVAA